MQLGDTKVYFDGKPLDVLGVSFQLRPRADAWCRFCGGDLLLGDIDMCCEGCTQRHRPTSWQVRVIYGGALRMSSSGLEVLSIS